MCECLDRGDNTAHVDECCYEAWRAFVGGMKSGVYVLGGVDEPKGCPTPGACSAVDEITRLRADNDEQRARASQAVAAAEEYRKENDSLRTDLAALREAAQTIVDAPLYVDTSERMQAAVHVLAALLTPEQRT